MDGDDVDHERLALADKRAFWQAEALAAILVAFGADPETALARAIDAVRWPDEQAPTPAQIRL